MTGTKKVRRPEDKGRTELCHTKSRNLSCSGLYFVLSGLYVYGGTLNDDGSYTKQGFPLTNAKASKGQSFALFKSSRREK